MPVEITIGGLTVDQIKDRQNRCALLNTFASHIPDRWPLCKAQCIWNEVTADSGPATCPQAAGTHETILVVPKSDESISSFMEEERNKKIVEEGKVIYKPLFDDSGVETLKYNASVEIVDYAPVAVGTTEASKQGLVYQARRLLGMTD